MQILTSQEKQQYIQQVSTDYSSLLEKELKITNSISTLKHALERVQYRENLKDFPEKTHSTLIERVKWKIWEDFLEQESCSKEKVISVAVQHLTAIIAHKTPSNYRKIQRVTNYRVHNKAMCILELTCLDLSIDLTISKSLYSVFKLCVTLESQFHSQLIQSLREYHY